ncbi:hypothetical protein K438DRAFT_1908885 [Mycena galopus ATCC 62051]|nr:hypothetical protein K438DRAFT_1908885 [Mycena galopus ATCC 62051]
MGSRGKSKSGKGTRGGARPPAPAMYVHQPHVATLFSVSDNGRRVMERSHAFSTFPIAPPYAQEDIITSAAIENWDFSYDLGDTSLHPEVQEPAASGVVLKRKVYENSDYPMLTWAEHRDEYLDEMLRLEGRGDHQTCYGTALYCQGCIVERHGVLPTHWIQEWNGHYFECRDLKSLGLIVQLGHPPGFGCPTAVKSHKDFVVIDVTGVHNVEVNFCNCDGRVERRQQLMRVRWWPATARDPQTCATFAVVRLFQTLNCLGKVSAHDFLRSLELLTNNDGLSPLPVLRQYRMTVMMKRAGRGHDPTGVKGTAQGELALQCRACPQAGRNLPDGWDKIDWKTMPEDLRYKYFLFLAQDCNFRLVNRNVGTAGKDPILADGCGYFVNHEKYTEFLRHHVTEEEILSCSGFQAMFLANKKRVKGLRTTGVGGVTANGIGDLQLGERFCNMDFILFSTLANIIILYLILSYDIACQYFKKFWTQMAELPSWMHLTLHHENVWFKVPNFHLPPHLPACHSPFSFHYMWGAGRTHGETIEQNWEFTNGAAASTKVMGLGTRHATLEDLFGFHNWRRTVASRRLLPKRMAEDVAEGVTHRDAFLAFDAALQETDPKLVASWKKWVDEWESRQHRDGTESPFELKEKVMSMRDIRLKLTKEELLRSGEGEEVQQEETPSTFILMGLQIEEAQRYLLVDVKAVANPTDSQKVEVLKRRATLVKRIRAFRKMQHTYMPNLRRFLTPTQRAMLESETDRDAEGVRLFMPSDIADRSGREKACAVGLPDVEGELRVGEAREALQSLRHGLRTRTMTNRFRLRHCTGQRMLTRGQGVLRQINLKIHRAKLRYRYARNAIKRLCGTGPWEKELRVLDDADVRALNERALNAEEAEQRKSLGDYENVAEEGGIAAYGVVALGEGHRTLSWIWYTAKGEGTTEQELVEALRVEWCKAYVRMRRWYEDVVLVEEEMRRTVEYGYWAAKEWRGRAEKRAVTVSQELQEGLSAYAREHERREIQTCEGLMAKWAGIREKGRAYISGEIGPGVEVVVTLDDDEGGVDEEEGSPDYEDEADDDLLD